MCNTISELNRRSFDLQIFIFLPESYIVHLIPHVCGLKDKNQYNTKLIVTKQTKEEETRVDSCPPTIQTSVKFRDFVEQYLGYLWTYHR